MSKRSNNNSNAKKAKQQTRNLYAKRLVFPTFPETWGTTALVSADFDKTPKLAKRLSPYNTAGSQVYFWRHQQDYGGIQSQIAGTDATGAVKFLLSDCNGYTDFSGCFDLYRLRAAHVQFNMQFQLPFASTIKIPSLFSVIDYDDATPVTLPQMTQYDTCVTSPPNTGIARTVVPRMAIAGYAGTFTGYVNTEDQWIDMGSPSVEHYGVKWGLNAGIPGQTELATFQISITYFWEFKSSR